MFMDESKETEATCRLDEAEYALEKAIGVFRRDAGSPPPPEAAEALVLVRACRSAVRSRIQLRDKYWEVAR
jgi:hypothetical protein